MALSDIAKSTIKVGLTPISQAGFSTILILGEHESFFERFRIYRNADEVLQDFSPGDAEYIAANRAFSQAFKPEKIVIGRRDPSGAVAQVDTITVGDTTQGFIRLVYFDGIEIARVIGSGAAVLAGLISQINASGAPVIATDGGGGTVTVTSDLPGQSFELTVLGPPSFESETSVANVEPTETATDALDAIVEAGADFYGIALISKRDTDIGDVAEWAESRGRLFAARTNNADAFTSATDDVLSELKGLSYFRTFVVAHKRAWQFPEVALLANRLSINPDEGSSTWVHVRLVGITPDALTASEEANLENKNATYYKTIAGANVTLGGKTSGGEWIDVVLGIDWLNARIAEGAASVKISAANGGGVTKKIPYTNEGVAVLEETLIKRLDVATSTGFLSPNPRFTVVAPRVEDLTPEQRASRELPAIRWSAQIAGAIHVSNFEGELIP
jgi:hypothetical protein